MAIGTLIKISNGGTIACGQGVGLIHDIPSVKEIIENIINSA